MPNTQKTFLALVKAPAVRNVEISLESSDILDAIYDDDNWELHENAEIFVGIFTGDETDVCKQAAASIHTDPANIRLLQLHDSNDRNNLPLEDLDMTVRTYHCLKLADIHTVGDILQYMDGDPENLGKIRNFSRRCIDETVEKLRQHGVVIPENN